MKRKLLSLFVLLALLMVGLPAQPARAAGTIYVVAGNHCSAPCGNTWGNAHPSLQTALAAAVSGDRIWVAEGAYYPGAAGDRTTTFTLKNGVEIYGGFNGTEIHLSDRDIAANPTILSGDIDRNDTNTDGNFIAETTADIVGDNAYHVVTGVTGATLDGFTITAGKADGAYPNNGGSGMRNRYSSPVLTNVTFSANSATYGGGMYNFGSSPILTDIIFSSNTAASNGGGMYNEQGSPTLTNVTFSGNSASKGGGIHNGNGSNPTLTNVTFSANSATYGGGMDNSYSNPTLNTVTFDNNTASTSGGGMHNDTSNPSLTNVTFSDNTASYGGGMSNVLTSNPSLTDVTFSGNTATNIGGGMYNNNSNPTLTNVTFSNNTTVFSGGGMFNSGSNPTLTDVTFSGNGANNFGGGMFNSGGSPALMDVTFSGNHAAYGGGMRNDNSSPTLTFVTFESNTATFGGGMHNSLSNPTLTNVTFSGNSATTNGGGMYNSNSDPTLTNVTFSDNSATTNGGGMYNTSDSHPTLLNTLIANSTSGGDCINEAGGSLNAASSHNLIEDSANACGLTNGVNGDIVGLDPNLGLLQDNGGSTLTHALLAGSPAIDTGDDASCPATDQRGVARPNGSHCDIGAYEFEVLAMTFRSVGAQDGWILESSETSTKGGTLDSTATTFNLGDGAQDKQYRAILHFNTTALPDNAVITKVTLKIRKQGLVGTNPFTILGGLKVDMRKPSFGGVALAVGDFQAAAGKVGVATFGATPVSNWYSALLNAQGRAYVNKTGTTQFRLRFAKDDNDDMGADYMKFFSGDHATASVRPTLIIEYYVPVP